MLYFYWPEITPAVPMPLFVPFKTTRAYIYFIKQSNFILNSVRDTLLHPTKINYIVTL